MLLWHAVTGVRYQGHNNQDVTGVSTRVLQLQSGHTCCEQDAKAHAVTSNVHARAGLEGAGRRYDLRRD